MIDFNKYLKRIGFTGVPEDDLKSLRLLHTKHLFSIPFENLDIHYGRKIILEPDLLFRKIVIDKRGGFCYELNGLFFELLISFGFNACMISARVYDTSEPGPEFDHMAIIVKLNNELWLADVGFGVSFLEPLKIEPGLVQQHNEKKYRIDKIDNENFNLTSSSGGEIYNNIYRFSLIPRELSEFRHMCEYHQTSADSHFTRNRIITLLDENGRKTISGMKIIITNNGTKSEISLKNEKEFRFKLKSLFGIDMH